MPDRVTCSSTKAASGRLCRLLALALFFVLLAAAGCQAGERRVAVRHVIDGDTVVLASGEHLRLWCIDTPEIGREGAPDQLFARRARRELQALLANGGLKLVLPPGQQSQSDGYGRLLGALRLADGRLANVAMVRAGWATYYPHPKSGSWLAADLLRAQRQAIADARGFWPEVLQRLERVGPMRGNIASLRFFTLDCRNADSIAPRNRVAFGDAGEAFRQGYAPARHCGIWPLVSQQGQGRAP